MTLGGNLAQAAKCLVSSNDIKQAIGLLQKRNDIQGGVESYFLVKNELFSTLFTA